MMKKKERMEEDEIIILKNIVYIWELRIEGSMVLRVFEKYMDQIFLWEFSLLDYSYKSINYQSYVVKYQYV